MIAEIVFWTLFAVIVYTFAGYPLIVRMLSQLFGKPTDHDETFLSSVSIILSVYNEEEVIEEKIANFLAMDYPSELIEFLIVSDCCSDGTDELVHRYENERIRLLVQTERSGKTRNLNRGVTEASGEILVFTDANAMFDQDAVRKLVRHFADADIGLVSGKSLYSDGCGCVTTGGAYRCYEDYIKSGESRLASIIGADGAIYALRKSLYEPLPPEYINDFIHTIHSVLKGYRAINDDEAVCREVIGESGGGELRRQTRIMAQSWLVYCSQIVRLVDSGKWGYAWQLTSHKLMRWLSIPLLVLLFVSNSMLLKNGIFYSVFFVLQLLFFVITLFGSRVRKGVLRIPYMFMLIHLGSIFGLVKYLSGNVYTTWNPRND